MPPTSTITTAIGASRANTISHPVTHLEEANLTLTGTSPVLAFWLGVALIDACLMLPAEVASGRVCTLHAKGASTAAYHRLL
jgi:hypothetical protein